MYKTANSKPIRLSSGSRICLRIVGPTAVGHCLVSLIRVMVMIMVVVRVVIRVCKMSSSNNNYTAPPPVLAQFKRGAKTVGRCTGVVI